MKNVYPIKNQFFLKFFICFSILCIQVLFSESSLAKNKDFRSLDIYGVNYLGKPVSNPKINFDAKTILNNHSVNQAKKVKIANQLYCLAWKKSDGEGTSSRLLPFFSVDNFGRCDHLQNAQPSLTLPTTFSKHFAEIELFKTTQDKIKSLFDTPFQKITPEQKPMPKKFYNEIWIYKDTKDTTALSDKEKGLLGPCNEHVFFPRLYLYFKDGILVGISQSPHTTLC